jgi:6-phosphofructokinase 1
VDESAAVENLVRLGVNILFTVGGDGTQRDGNDLFQLAQQRGHALAVVGIPKTVDNDVAFVSRTFGYLTAVQEASSVLDRAHSEARSVQNGIALVKVMGRHAGFIAAGATVASQEVNFCLIPEVPFKLDNFLAALKHRGRKRGHAVIVVPLLRFHQSRALTIWIAGAPPERLPGFLAFAGHAQHHGLAAVGARWLSVRRV